MSLFYKTRIGSISLLFFLIAGFFNFVFAQTDEELGIPKGVQISPSRIDWDLKSGEERIGVVNLKNFSDKKFKVQIEVENFYVSDDSTEAKFFVSDENHPLKAYDVINWIELENKTVNLEPKEGKDIYFKVNVPKDTPTGGYYGALFFKSAVSENKFTNPEGGESRIMINQRVGMLLVMAVQGKEPIKKSGELLSFFSSKKVFFNSPAEFETEVKNSGNLHYQVFGKIDIYKFNKRLNTLELTPRVLYPNKTRKFLNEWKFSNWSYGYYKAKLAMASEDEKIRISNETTFWVIPWKTTVSIIILLTIIWLIFRIFTSRFEIKKKKKETSDFLIKDDYKEINLSKSEE